MLFQSFHFLFIFLPLVWAGYFLLNRYQPNWNAGKWLLIVASLVFYGYWNWLFIPLLLTSMLLNYGIGYVLLQDKPPATVVPWLNISRKTLLGLGLTFNVLLLGFFKYTNFLIDNWNGVFQAHVHALPIILPLGISFFTFQKIAHLVDCYQKRTYVYRFVNYALFVLFFPQLISGPIVHHKDIVPQFEAEKNTHIRLKNLAIGLSILITGLAKKVLIADSLSGWVGGGFTHATELGFFESWLVVYAYAMQLYFDFSGYSDMAIGLARMFNIVLPTNFNSPYQASDLQDFWRRWHMSLSRFLRNYVYIPLGGNRGPLWQTLRNVLLTFLLGGFWHGAAWTFVVWGLLHGVGLCAQQLYQTWQQRPFMPRWLGRLLTFHWVCVAWVFFRAPDLKTAIVLLQGMAGMHTFQLPQEMQPVLQGLHGIGPVQLLRRIEHSLNSIRALQMDTWLLPAISRLGQWPVEKWFKSTPAEDTWPWSTGLLVLVTALALYLPKGTDQRFWRFRPSIGLAMALGIVATFSLMNSSKISEFLYFNF